MSQWNRQNDDVFVAEYAQPPFGAEHTKNSELSCGVVVILLFAARMFEKGQIDAFSVSTTIEVEGAQQLVTMQVDSIEVADYTVSFIGMIEPNSLLDSRFVEEVKYSISLNSVIEFSYSKSRAPQDRSKQSFRKTWNQETN